MFAFCDLGKDTNPPLLHLRNLPGLDCTNGHYWKVPEASRASKSKYLF